MPRIRTIKPEFWSDEKLSVLDPLTRLVFVGLISYADDAGRLLDNVKLLDGLLFPNTDDSCRSALDILARLGRIHRYRSASGQSVIQIVKWRQHQKIDHPSKIVLPAPPSAEVGQSIVQKGDTGQPPTTVVDARETDAKRSRESREDLAPDLGPWIKDQGPRNGEQPQAAPHDSVATCEHLDDLVIVSPNVQMRPLRNV